VPDVALGRRLYGLEGLPDAQWRRQCCTAPPGHGRGFFCPWSSTAWWRSRVRCVRRRGCGCGVSVTVRPPRANWCSAFFDGVEKFSPDLVSWKRLGVRSAGADLPALLAGLRRRVSGRPERRNPAFRYNNYLSRYHWRHTDLMDVLSGFQSRGRVSLAPWACLLGLPGKRFRGDQVWEAWQSGNLAGIRRYCETDVLNTWLIYLPRAAAAGSSRASSTRRSSSGEDPVAGRAGTAPDRVPARLGGGP